MVSVPSSSTQQVWKFLTWQRSTDTHASQQALQKSCPQGISTGSSNTEILHMQMSHCKWQKCFRLRNTLKLFVLLAEWVMLENLSKNLKQCSAGGKKSSCIQKKKLFKLQEWERFGISVSVTPYAESTFWAAFCSILELRKCFTLQSVGISGF